MKTCLELSRTRYTTKHYDKSKKIPQDQLQQLLEILQNTPSSLNAQPWHFIVIDNQKSHQKILPAIASFNHARFTDSSYTIAFCIPDPFTDAHLEKVTEQEYRDGRFQDEEQKMIRHTERANAVFTNKAHAELGIEGWAKNQVYIALGQLMYATEELGIDSTAVGGFDSKEFDRILGLKARGLKSEVLITLGYRAQDDSNAKRPKSRLSLEEIVSFWE